MHVNFTCILYTVQWTLLFKVHCTLCTIMYSVQYTLYPTTHHVYPSYPPCLPQLPTTYNPTLPYPTSGIASMLRVLGIYEVSVVTFRWATSANLDVTGCAWECLEVFSRSPGASVGDDESIRAVRAHGPWRLETGDRVENRDACFSLLCERW